ncbi:MULTISPECIES: hypothetical protein [Pseudomonas]|uniref:Uncharacterized protein n=1 Tax=Pseudomonas paracarnis TaxID=2750625 RepID=A0ABU6BQ84_9PSED|nr:MULTISPECIES: hypothetical protein [Pseudomonas]MBR7522419.1 hypothetical protein [Pseudomonas juntendi]MEB3782391.1 hypothetical protein [Pseudomonas paracarnis]HDS0926257.1 hypothetical protein [Pseudomonas putida]
MIDSYEYEKISLDIDNAFTYKPDASLYKKNAARNTPKLTEQIYFSLCAALSFSIFWAYCVTIILSLLNDTRTELELVDFGLVAFLVALTQAIILRAIRGCLIWQEK